MTEIATPMLPIPAVGRAFTSSRKVRLGDVRPSGILRLDALTRYTQDVSNDDTTDAQLPDNMAWVVRRTTVDVLAEAQFGELLEFTTFCSGLGNRWAERRLHVTGSMGAHYEVATLWVHLDERSGRPRRLDEAFLALYAEAAGGREVSARLLHDPLPEASERCPWPSRVVDFDLFKHMNNAAYWAAVEQQFAHHPLSTPTRCSVEYGRGIGLDEEVELATAAHADGWGLWWLAGDGGSAASAEIKALPSGLYRSAT